MKPFNAKVILTLITGRLYCGDIGELYEILNYLLDESLMTHHLPPAANFSREQVLNQLPAEFSKVCQNWIHNDDTWKEDLLVYEGKTFDLSPLDKTGFAEYMVDNSLLLKRLRE